MADTVASHLLWQNSKYAFYTFENVSDGTGEAAVAKVDISGLTGTPTKVTIKKLWWNCVGMAVRILFDHTTDDAVFLCAGDGHLCMKDSPGIADPASSGGTGDILFTTVGHTSGDMYSISMLIKKD